MKVELIDSMGTDLTVVNAARVSYNKESQLIDPYEPDASNYGVPELVDTEHTLAERDIKLINYLARHKHWSPFSHCFLQLKIQAPIFIARQLAKHQVGLAWNEVSRRYVSSDPQFYTPDKWRGKPENSKQGSTGESESQYFPARYLQEVTDLALQSYQKMIQQGVAPEMARMILPQNMMTDWYWSGSLYAFSRICKLRLDEHSQVEVQAVAKQIADYCSTLFPHSWDALLKGV